MRTNYVVLACLTVGFGVCSPQAFAGPLLTMSLDTPLIIGMPGAAVTFAGTIQNSSGVELFLNGAGGSPSYSELTLDLTPFFTLTPLSLLDGESYTGDIFAVAISGVALPGTYFGTFTIQGGVDSQTFDTVGSADFQVTVADTAAVPEPSSGALFGLAGFMVLVGRALQARSRCRRLLNHL